MLKYFSIFLIAVLLFFGFSNSNSDYAQLYLSNSKSAGGGTAPTSSIRAGS